MISIDSLPDEALLQIFYLFVDEDEDEDGLKKHFVEESRKEWQSLVHKWQSLVHVCRRWRSVVFGSPRRLNLRLIFKPGTPVRDTVDFWPPLPLVIQGSIRRTDPDLDNLITALERRDRVCQIHLSGVELPSERAMVAMQELFPELTDLVLISDTTMIPPLPDSFLGGSAPRLRNLLLVRVPFPGLPKLLLSATHLVNIRLYGVPHSGFFSPEALVTALSSSTSLRLLVLGLRSSPGKPASAPNTLSPSRSRHADF